MDSYMVMLRKALYRRLPNSTEYRASRRIEGWMDPVEEAAPHRYVTFIVDDEITQPDYDQIIERTRHFLKKDQYFKQSRYMIYLWKQDTLTNMTPSGLSTVRISHSEFGVFQVGGTAGGDWSKFTELYAPHRRAGQVILITTKDKVEKLKTENIPRIKNLLIIYCGGPDAKPAKMVSDNVCMDAGEPRKPAGTSSGT